MMIDDSENSIESERVGVVLYNEYLICTACKTKKSEVNKIIGQ